MINFRRYLHHLEKTIVLLSIVIIFVIAFLITTTEFFKGYIEHNRPDIIHIDSFIHDIVLSPDNKHMAITYVENGLSSIYIGNIDGMNIGLLTTQRPQGSQHRPLFLPEGSKILFLSDRSLLTCNIDGSNLKRVANLNLDHEHSFFNFILSRDGKRILFISNPSQTAKPQSELHIMNADGSGQTKLTSFGEYITEAIFSPDMKKIYFLKSALYGHYSPIAPSSSHAFDIFSINIDGSGLKQITHNKAYRMEGLSFVQDGKKLFYNDARSFKLIELDHPQEVRNINPSSEKTNISTTKNPKKAEDAMDLRRPLVSPDGKKIAFTAAVKEGLPNIRGRFQYEMFIMDMNTRKVTQLTRLGLNSTARAFTPDSKRIIFANNVAWPRPQQINRWMIINTDGTDLHVIDMPTKDQCPSNKP